MYQEGWNENAKYILTAIDVLTENQKELIDKVDAYHETIACQRNECSKRFVSKWVVGLLVTVVLGISSILSYNTYDIYTKVHTNSTKITTNKIKLDEFKADFEEIRDKMHLAKYRLTIKNDKGTEIFWFEPKNNGTLKDVEVNPPTDSSDMVLVMVP